ncbi:MAG: phosphomannomutase/phosphoglucomutase [Acidobacteriota bacterium]|nr:MAG: phosphomannomutase/phosphoglucomutase [Acidobacteriota bacterium]
MNREIFREYDIRGIADRDLVPEAIVKLGKSIAVYMLREGRRRIAVGRDVRLSSKRLRDNLVEGLTSCGIDVVDIGECPTPLLYYALYKLDVDGGVMITGSHNPAEYNGFKVSAGRASLHGEQIQDLLQIAEAGEFPAGSGRVETVSVRDRYIEEIADTFGTLNRPVKVVVDCGNGAASILAVEVFERLGCEVVPLFCEVDGRFPNHHPDPTVEEFLQDLIRQVRESGAELGIAFDGDGDRIGAVDHEGRIIWGDELMVLFSRSVLKDNPGATIIGEVKCSKTLYDDITRRGGKAVMWKAGHSLIKAKMRETGALLGGEMSGHMFFADRFYGFDDAIYAGARLLEICAGAQESVAEMLSDLPKTFHTPEIRMDSPEPIKFEVVKRAQDFFSEHYDAVTIDGVRVLFDDGWGLVRASNTQPALVLRFEAVTEQRLGEIRGLLEGKLEEITREVSAGA